MTPVKIQINERPEAEFALVIADAYQKRGLGTEILVRLIGIARDEGFHLLRADILRANVSMLRLCRALGFQIDTNTEPDVALARLIL